MSASEHVAVEGIVTLDGTPIADAAVLFLPLPGGAPTSCVTDDKGRFKLETTILPGQQERDFRVAISKTERPAEQSDLTAGAEQPLREGFVSAEQLNEVNLLPAKYVNATTSELSANVRKGSRNTFTFSLTTDESVGEVQAAPEQPATPAKDTEKSESSDNSPSAS